jgi:hypothetical protein
MCKVIPPFLHILVARSTVSVAVPCFRQLVQVFKISDENLIIKSLRLRYKNVFTLNYLQSVNQEIYHLYWLYNKHWFYNIKHVTVIVQKCCLHNISTVPSKIYLQ